MILALGPAHRRRPDRGAAGAEGGGHLDRRPLGGRGRWEDARRSRSVLDRRHRPLDGRCRALAGRGAGRARGVRAGLPPRPGAAPPPPFADQPASLPHPDRGGGRSSRSSPAILAQICRVSRQGDDWRDVIDSMRPVTPQLWKALTVEQKERFLTDYQRLWDVHRFRMAPDIADRYEALAAAGRIEDRGRLDRLGRAARLPRPRLPAHAGRPRARVGRGRPGDQLLGRRLRPAPPGAAGPGGPPQRRPRRPDELGLGLDVDEHGALLDREGLPSERLFAIGALRKGVEWEAIGITEIRDHSGAVARKIIRTGGNRRDSIADRAAPRRRRSDRMGGC